MSDRAEDPSRKPVYRSVLAPQGRRDQTLLAIMLLAVFSLAGTIALLPGSEEKAEALLAEGRYGDAIEILVAVEDERPLDAYEGYMLFKLYMLTKQPDNAAMVLEQEPALQADNAWALRQLSDLYRQVRNVSGEATALRRLYDISPTDADFARLRVLYRLSGDVAREASLLAQAIAAGRVDQAHIDRLAYLESMSGLAARASLWVAPSSSYSNLTKSPPFHSLALSEPTTPVTTQPE